MCSRVLHQSLARSQIKFTKVRQNTVCVKPENFENTAFKFNIDRSLIHKLIPHMQKNTKSYKSFTYKAM